MELHTTPTELPKPIERAYFSDFGTVVRFVIIGILLPLIALAFELSNNISELTYFDPVPTFFHGVLIVFVA